jgi:ABC-2 type transport system permease protein
MRDFLSAQSYYLRKDATFRGITLLFLIGSLGLVVWIGSVAGFDILSPLEPLRTALPFSLFLYFVIPVHASFYSTEGFEYGSVKNITASGLSRSSYILGKYMMQLLAAACWLIQFFGLFSAAYLAAALVTGARIGGEGLIEDLQAACTAIGLNLLYLAAYSAIIMMAGLIVRRAASAAVITFVVILGDLLLGGYLKGSSSAFGRMVSEHSLMTQVMKFNGIYVADSKRVILSGAGDYIPVILTAVVLIAGSLAVAVITFTKRDIHA